MASFLTLPYLLILGAALLFINTPNVGVCNCSMFCCTLLYFPSSFAIILMGKRELVALLSLYSWCLMIVVWFFLAVQWVCLQFVIVVFPDQTHLLFLYCYSFLFACFCKCILCLHLSVIAFVFQVFLNFIIMTQII